MSRYIDAEQLEKDDWKLMRTPHGLRAVDCEIMELDCVPTADVRENVKGEWIDAPNREFCFRADFKTIKCNKCGYNMPKCDSFANNFCPNCGADMRGESK